MANSYQRCIQLQKTANMTTIGYRAIRYVLLTTKGGGGGPQWPPYRDLLTENYTACYRQVVAPKPLQIK